MEGIKNSVKLSLNVRLKHARQSSLCDFLLFYFNSFALEIRSEFYEPKIVDSILGSTATYAAAASTAAAGAA